jgi:hypothetical protein
MYYLNIILAMNILGLELSVFLICSSVLYSSVTQRKCCITGQQAQELHAEYELSCCNIKSHVMAVQFFLPAVDSSVWRYSASHSK